MDFIERLLDVSPDGGNGVTEASLVLGIFLVVMAIVFRRAIARATRRRIDRT